MGANVMETGFKLCSICGWSDTHCVGHDVIGERDRFFSVTLKRHPEAVDEYMANRKYWHKRMKDAGLLSKREEKLL